MRIELPPPLTQAPPPRSAWQDFKLLLVTQLRVTWNKIRHWPVLTWVLLLAMAIGFLSLLVFLSILAFGALRTMDPHIARGFLSLLFMVGLAALTFFGLTAAFTTLYMSDDLELLFSAPVSTRAVFAVKSLVVAASNFLTTALFVLIPGLFFGLLFSAGFTFYLSLVLTGLGLLAVGTALAELLNLMVMRVVPPHRSREAVGVIGAVAGIIIALFFQIPNLVMSGNGNFNIGGWLAGQQQLLRLMDYFPWGWGSAALAAGAAGNHLAGLGWSLLLLALGTAIFAVSFLLVERGFRRGWIAVSAEGGGRRRKQRRHSSGRTVLRQQQEATAPPAVIGTGAASGFAASPAWQGMWSVAKKDLLYMKRDTREWFGYLVPLIIMAFFVGRFLFLPDETAEVTMVTVLFMYTIMFSGNMALQSFGREGEAEWVLNSVPLAGWPVVWGKLLAAVLPTLVLMELLLAGTALAIGLSATVTLGLAVGAVFITLNASAIGLFYSINNCRYNPDAPQQRISSGASLLMYLLNLLFVGLVAFGLVYLFPPAEFVALLREIPPPSLIRRFLDVLALAAYLLSRPLFWPPVLRVITGIVITVGIWAAVFFSFMAAAVRQSRKGFRVEIITTSRRGKLRRK